MDRDVITLSHKHTLPLKHRPPPLPPNHPHTPVTTANPKPCHNRERVTPQSAKPLQSISHKREKIKRHSNPSQHTALHSHAITGTLEWGWLREEGRGERGRHFLSNPPPSSGLLLHCGHLLILCWYAGGQLAAGSNHGRRLDRRNIVSNI